MGFDADVWLGVLALIAGAAFGFMVYRRAQRRARRAHRRVEKPNSYYASPGVRRLADIERWERIALAEIHPVNRAEVVRLLAVAREAGPDTLSQRERQFLDTMAPD